jgi:2-haloacid dehalogenase
MTDRASDGTPAVVFDLGGVLIDWDPRHLFRKILPDDPAKMEWFLANVCNDEWNLEQDAGRPFAEAVALACAAHPEHTDLIHAYHRRWPEMLNGALADSVAILAELKRQGRPLYALTNWSAETFPVALERFDFLHWFDGIVVSGEIRLRKPDHRIFAHLVERYGLAAPSTFYVDDSARNVAAARAFGLDAVQFTSPEGLRADLAVRGLL